MAETIYYYEKKKEKAMLVVFDGSGSVTTYPITQRTAIGRIPNEDMKSIVISSSIVSRKQGEINIANGEYYYKDTESKNGTYINGEVYGIKVLSEKTETILKDGDILLVDLKKNGRHDPECVLMLFLTSVSSEHDWRRIELNADMKEICIGRSETSGLQMENAMISEKHASFFCAKSGWAIIDHASTNGVFLNGRRLSSPRYLSKYDVVRICDSFFVFMEDCIVYTEEPRKEKNLETTASPQLLINIYERSVVQRFKKKLLLQDINISVANGEMVLILGGSGAGKTTFINAVMGYEKAKAEIIYRDTDIYQEYEQMKYEIGFVPQQDLLRGSDTVYETLKDAARVKLPKSYSHEERVKRIDEVLKEFGLEKEKFSLVSKISGGQRKRLSIAVEFIANPSLFFLDEPDSGLDTETGRGVMENLREIANVGKIVMLITHSPERAEDLFDKVMVLAKSAKDNCGHLAFYGKVEDAYKFFEASSFGEIIKKVNNSDSGIADFYIEKYRQLNLRR